MRCSTTLDAQMVGQNAQAFLAQLGRDPVTCGALRGARAVNYPKSPMVSKRLSQIHTACTIKFKNAKNIYLFATLAKPLFKSNFENIRWHL
jgi:hypothetical protein